MDTCQFLTILFMVITSGSAAPECVNCDLESFERPEGEAFYFLPYALEEGVPDQNITWQKIDGTGGISNNQDEMVHCHEGALYFLKLKIEDSGVYRARHEDSVKCYFYDLKLAVFDKSKHANKLLSQPIKEASEEIHVPCPDLIKETCYKFDGEYTWEKDSQPLLNEKSEELWVINDSKSKEGIYTCICTWEHRKKKYITSSSRRLEIEDLVVHQQLRILNPIDREQFADEGFGITLNCSVQCGINVGSYCHARWLIDGSPVNQTEGYSQSTKIENPKENTTAIAVLTIQKVTAKDFRTIFTCAVNGRDTASSATLTLKPRESVVPLIIGGLCVSLLCVIAAVLIKYFAIDLALFFRPYLPLSHNRDGRVYDAYVVYNMQDMDKATEDALCVFVSKNLPSVLEEKCGYRLFIHGRDDIPGEDRLELVEDRMKQSRRLMVILTPGSGSESSPFSHEDSVIGGFDWQVGLHHAMVQREMSVILIQLGDMGRQGYTHLPPGLQHLIHKSAPVRWPETTRSASAKNSRFWKRVRYLMPATPAKKSHQSSLI
ncbi:interleukin-1 receptor type 1 [Notolabrus celidotus]|uniref:interleukin-1 receptor type 1 n=1 Tax=Notolabrus celidotus TaxID=1203425 RepID=UPI0014903940|nr:interleukin-1 receptor type 1 [Notolabrus celidotus]